MGQQQSHNNPNDQDSDGDSIIPSNRIQRIRDESSSSSSRQIDDRSPYPIRRRSTRSSANSANNVPTSDNINNSLFYNGTDDMEYYPYSESFETISPTDNNHNNHGDDSEDTLIRNIRSTYGSYSYANSRSRHSSRSTESRSRISTGGSFLSAVPLSNTLDSSTSSRIIDASTNTSSSQRSRYRAAPSQENAIATESERSPGDESDVGFERFLETLQLRHREASNRSQTTPNNTVATIADGVTTSIPSSLLNSEEFIPDTIIIIGIRSVPPRLEEQNGNYSIVQESIVYEQADPRRDDSNNNSRERSSATTSGRNSSRSTSSTGTQTPPSRSWIIYVIGGTYPPNHPIFSTASLFSDNPTYEDMLTLTTLLGPARPPTTTQSEIEATFPIVLYDENISGVKDRVLLGNSEKCQVCLCDYVTDEELRVLNCNHGFHKDCIDKWLTEGSNKCPICRGVGVPSNEEVGEAMPSLLA
ncbi:9751_t:CDS:2 [Entrophospora sp. SA101]|nr:3879_t:CDS:2 [Entrophospora sp. SA101]CAJ0632157.1 9751_t:CDS:2 [Entrophospora sp. SA101]CAJ0827521.1 9980_t:CDS:2 [Entrophospora sp. SA101]CAJ0858717.1 8169_t:CDS:2 [Entrophospora sp. SA101]